MTWQTINPASGAIVASYEETSPKAVQAIIASAHQAYLTHPRWDRRNSEMRGRVRLLRGKRR
jgi:acyl-CoA reductase-like NAD-dependent aldehyde dehydrogenase